MLLNLRIVEIYSSSSQYIFFGALIGLFLISESFLCFKINNFNVSLNYFYIEYWVNILHNKNNLKLIGELIYNYYNHFFIAAAFISLTAMIGSIVITTDIDNMLISNSSRISIYKENINIFFWKYVKR